MSGIEVQEVLSVKRYKCGYEVRTEIWAYNGKDTTEIHAAYTPNGDYIGSSKDAHRLCVKRGIAPEKSKPGDCVCSIGYSRKDGKWYGWSHRAIYGFRVGSECKKGQCHYVPNTFQEIKKDCHLLVKGKCHAHAGRKTVGENPDGSLILGPQRGIRKCCPRNCVFETGRGEWTAETTADARQMALDFAEGVS